MYMRGFITRDVFTRDFYSRLSMIDETLEFQITQYLDGDLSPDAVAALDQRLADDPEARQLLDEYRKLNNVLAAAPPVPAVNWDRLAAGISASVDEDFEYTLLDYLDGNLPDEEQASVKQRVSHDARAAATLDQYRALDKVLEPAAIQKSWPLPDVKWDRLADHISSAIDEESQASRMRIGTWARTTARIALAASILLTIGLWVKFYKPGTADVHVTAPNPELTASAVQLGRTP